MEGESAAHVVELLASYGVAVEPGDIERREHRWLARAGGLLVWLAADDEGARELIRERAVLEATRGRLGIAMPEVIEVFPGGSGDIRRPVPGLVDHVAMRRSICGDAALAQRVGEQLGHALAALHRTPPPASTLPSIAWPAPATWIREALPDVITDASLIARIHATLDDFETARAGEIDRVLAHTDVGYHNLVFDPSSLELVGIFDFAEAAHDDRHWDLSDLITEGALTVAMRASYEEATGTTIENARLHLYNAVKAFSYLANRRGVDPTAMWCGRTMSQDLAWCQSALDRLWR